MTVMVTIYSSPVTSSHLGEQLIGQFLVFIPRIRWLILNINIINYNICHISEGFLNWGYPWIPPNHRFQCFFYIINHSLRVPPWLRKHPHLLFVWPSWEPPRSQKFRKSNTHLGASSASDGFSLFEGIPYMIKIGCYGICWCGVHSNF